MIFSMTPKPKAETGARLRPIAMLPYVYRARMAIRKSQSKEWSLRLHQGKHIGAAALAAKTRALIEVKHCQGDQNLPAFLDRNECYERAGHALAGTRPSQSGLAARVANMVFDMYRGHRHVKVHGGGCPTPDLRARTGCKLRVREGHPQGLPGTDKRGVPKRQAPGQHYDITLEVSAPTAALCAMTM